MNKYLFSLLLLCTVAISCSKEDDFESIYDSETEKAQNWFTNEFDRQQYQTLNYTESPDWCNATVSCTKFSHVVEVPLFLKPEFKTTSDNNPNHKIQIRLLLFAETNSYSTALAFIDSESNSDAFLANTNNINYNYIDKEFIGRVSLFNEKQKSLGLNLFIDGERIIETSTLKTAPRDCYQLVEFFSDGSTRPVGPKYCPDNGLENGYGGGGNGGNPGAGTPDPNPGPEVDPTKWNSENSVAKKIIECGHLNNIVQKKWFDLTNGERMAHIIDAMRYENKHLENNGYIDFNQIFDFGSIKPTDCYTPVFAGRVIIDGVTLDITIDFTLIGNNTVGTNGTRIPLPDPFDANIKGYHKTGYWAGYRFYTQNTKLGGAEIMQINIKLGEKTNEIKNAEIFLNALESCKN